LGKKLSEETHITPLSSTQIHRLDLDTYVSSGEPVG
jgi:hypothetical protein